MNYFLRGNVVALLTIWAVGCATLASELNIPLDADVSPREVAFTDLLTLRELGGVGGTGLSVSPDGNYVAFELHQADIATNRYRVAWFVASTSTGAVVNVGDGGHPTLFRNRLPSGRIVGAWVSEYPKWSPDGRGIAYRKRKDGDTQVWWSSRDGAEVRQLTRNAADVEEFYWSRDGSRILFATGANRAELRKAEEARYRNGHVFDYDIPWSTIDGRPFYPPYSLTGGEPRIWVLDVVSRDERLATVDEQLEYEQLKQPAVSTEQVAGARQIAWTKDKRGVAWVQPDDPHKRGRYPPLTLYASLETDGSNQVRCPAEECTGIFDLRRMLRDGIYWDSIQDEILFVRKEGIGYSRRTLYGWHIGEEHVRRIFTTDEWISDCSIVRDRALCFRETPSYPRTIVSIDLADGSITTLVDPNPAFQHLIIGDVELFEWTNCYGYGTFGYLVKPPDWVPGRRYPLVFVGYRARTALRGGVGNEYPVHVLAANGFVVLVYETAEVHEALEIYNDPLDVGRARWAGSKPFDGRMALASFEAVVEILGEQGLIDPAKVAVTGLSAGVADVNYSLIHSDLVAAAITSSSQWSPSANFLGGAAGDFIREYRRVTGAGRYGGPNGWLWEHMSLALNTERVNAPLLVNVSDSESPWSLEEVIRLIEADKPVEMVVYPDEGHIKWQPVHRLAVYERNVDWLKFWLQGIEDPDPTKSGQYARWRVLRDKHVKRESVSVAEPAN